MQILLEHIGRPLESFFVLHAIYTLKQRHPQAEIDLVISGPMLAFAKLCPLVRNIHVAPSGRFSRTRFIRELAAENGYKIFISLSGCRWSNFGAKLAKIPLRMALANAFLVRFLANVTVTQSRDDLGSHFTDHINRLLKHAGITESIPKNVLVAAAAERAEVSEAFQKFLNPGRKTILLLTPNIGGPNASFSEKKLTEFAEKIIEEKQFNLVLAHENISMSPLIGIRTLNVLNCTTPVTHGKMVALIQACDYFVGGFGPWTHVAGLLEKPILTEAISDLVTQLHFGPLAPYIFTAPPEKNLFSAFVDLKNKVGLTIPADFNEMRTRYFLPMARILYLPKNRKEYSQNLPAIQALQDDGLTIFCGKVNGWEWFWPMLHFVQSRNITILQGNYDEIPGYRLLCWILRFRKRVPPIWVPLGLHDHIAFHELIAIYRSFFQKRG